jgi:hypothetical protein
VPTTPMEGGHAEFIIGLAGIAKATSMIWR